MNKRNTRIGILVLTILSVFAAKLLVLRQMGDIDWEPDGFMHFLQLRTVFTNFPHNLAIGITTWAKPLFIYPLGFFVNLFDVQHLLTMQVVNMLLILAISVVVYKILREQKTSFALSWLGLMLTNFSFLLFRSSLTSLTEPIFTLFLITGYYFFIKKRFDLSALFIGLSVLGRIEGAYFVLIWGVYLFIVNKDRRQLIKQYVLLLIPAFIWNLVGFLQTGRPFYLISNGYPTAAGAYGYGGKLDYAAGFIYLEPIILLLALLSIGYVIEILKRKQVSQQLAVVTFVGFFVIQSLLWMFGLFGTAGLMRYFVSVMPFLIIPAVLFLNQVFTSLSYSRYKLMSVAVLIALMQVGFSLVVMHRGGDFLGPLYPTVQPALKEAGEWVKDNVKTQEFVSVDQPAILYYANRDLNNSDIDIKDNWASKTPGVYVWSRDWGTSMGISLADLQQHATQLASFEDYSFIFQVR